MKKISCIKLLLVLKAVMCEGQQGQAGSCVGHNCEDSKILAVQKDKGSVLAIADHHSQSSKEDLVNYMSDDLQSKRTGIVKSIMADMKKSGVLTGRCVGSECTQNNARKEGIKSEASEEVSLAIKGKQAEQQLEKDLQEEIDQGTGIESMYATISAYLRSLFLIPDARFNLRFLSNTRHSATRPTVQSFAKSNKQTTLEPSPRNINGSTSPELSKFSNNEPFGSSPGTSSPPYFNLNLNVSKTTAWNTTQPIPDSPSLVLECSGPITSYCQARNCRVKCIDGRKVSIAATSYFM